MRSFDDTRTCAVEDRDTQLSRYNPAPYCYLHEGWDREQKTRARRHAPESPLAPPTADDHPVD